MSSRLGDMSSRLGRVERMQGAIFENTLRKEASRQV